jgi:hypothetical protein
MFKAFKPQKWAIFIFFKHLFFLPKCSPFLLKIGEDFNIDDYKGKMTSIKEFFLYKQFEDI